jgi:hypothetical protein
VIQSRKSQRTATKHCGFEKICGAYASVDVYLFGLRAADDVSELRGELEKVAQIESVDSLALIPDMNADYRRRSLYSIHHVCYPILSTTFP